MQLDILTNVLVTLLHYWLLLPIHLLTTRVYYLKLTRQQVWSSFGYGDRQVERIYVKSM